MYQKLLFKLSSARFLISIILTTFISIFTLISLLSLGNLSISQEVLQARKEIFMFIGGAFITIATTAITSYFNRTDRKKEDKNENI